MKIIVFKKQNGKLVIVYPEYKTKSDKESTNEFLNRIIDKIKPSIENIDFVEIVDDSIIPSDRSNRNNWTKQKNGPIEVM